MTLVVAAVVVGSIAALIVVKRRRKAALWRKQAGLTSDPVSDGADHPEGRSV